MGKRGARQEAIKRIVREHKVRTQRQLADLLVEAGHPCTQATVSRDITMMGLQKTPDGYYVLQEDLHLARMMRELVTEVVAASNLVVVKSLPGGAQGVGAALDGAGLEGVIGSVAGDDTILLVAADEEGASDVVAQIDRYRR
ncbi:MAG: arginine repressor [Coriobacteriia bacterium]